MTSTFHKAQVVWCICFVTNHGSGCYVGQLQADAPLLRVIQLSVTCTEYASVCNNWNV